MTPLRRVIGRAIPYPLRLVRIRAIQRIGLWRERIAPSQKLVLFLVPGQELFSGGILSIFSLYRLSRCLEQIHGFRVLMCFYPAEARTAFKYWMFENNVMIYPFEMVLQVCHKATAVLLHVPEYAVLQVTSRLGNDGLTDLRRRHGLRINILNQNVTLMPERAVIQSLKQVIPDLTMTTAHPRYSTAEQRGNWGIPIHFVPAWFHPDDAPATMFETKRDLMLVSPDPSPHRDEVLDVIRKALPRLELRVIKNLPFEKYIELERSAKWALTFGEGLDGYFVGIVFRGGIGFAVYNDEFFTPEYGQLRTVYSSFDSLQARIGDDLIALDSKAAMEAYNAQVRTLLTNTWGPDKTRSALEAFYRREFTYP